MEFINECKHARLYFSFSHACRCTPQRQLVLKRAQERHKRKKEAIRERERETKKLNVPNMIEI